MSWIRTILSTSKTTVMLNGVPGSWINYTNGLRQGDPLSPYLFIIIADILQQQIIQSFDAASICHPIYDHLPPTTLQYADDTLITTKAFPQAAHKLKLILDDFAQKLQASLSISKNYIRYYACGPNNLYLYSLCPGCPISSFPQVYLGLRLSPYKLPSSAFCPIIDRCLSYLTG